MTKIVIPTENQEGINAKVAEHFGRASNFTILELNDNKVVSVKSQANTGEHVGGTGHPHENLLTLKPDYIIACGMGPGGLQSFKNAGIMVLKAEGATVKEVIANFKDGKLEELVAGCAHAHEHHHEH